MAKRGAGDQLTKDDYDDRRDGDEEDPGTREAPLAPVAGRVGMPKRKGLAPSTEAPAQAPTPAADAPKPSAFSGFSFGGASSTPAPSFSFGATSSTAPASTPTPAAASPFSNFSFSKPALPAASAAAHTTTDEKKSSDETGEPAAKKAFSGFSFKPSAPSANAPASSPFSFGAASTPSAPASTPATTDSAPKPSFSFGSSSASATPSVSTGPFSFGQPAKDTSSALKPVKPTVPAPASPFAPLSATTASAATKHTTSAPTSSTAPAEGEVKYYTSLRGLNTSILSFLTSTLENDAFVNLGDVLPGLAEQYKKLLEQEANKAGWQPADSASVSTSTYTAPPSKPAEEPKKTAPPAPPSVPSGGFSFGGQTSSATTSSTSTGKGFTPTLPAGGSSSSSPFTFGGKPAETPKKPSAEVTKLVQDAISGKPEEKEETPAAKPFSFSFGSAPTATPDKKSGSSLFSFAPSGPIAPATPDSKSFSPSANLESVSSSTPPAKLGKFGPGGSAPQLAFGGASSTSGTPGGAKPTGFAFGSSSGSEGGFSLGSGAPFASQTKAPDSKPAASTPSFSFGATSTPAASKTASSFTFGGPPSSSSFSFGASSGSPSFSFGGSSQPAQSTLAQSTSISSSFGSSASAPAKKDDESTTEKPEDAVEGESAEAAEPSVNRAETTGAGEEGEETLSTHRARLYKLENGAYASVGVGTIKLKKKTDDKKRRLLMRTDGNGVVILNMAVSATFAPTVEKNSIKFLGTDLEGKPMGYTLRVKTAEMASEFMGAVTKEIEEIKNE